jgi:type I restriction enzyme S subunit
LALSATTKGYFKPDCFKYVDITEETAERFFLKQGDLLIQRGNSIEYVGMAALYDHADDQFIYPDLMMRLRLTKHCNGRFIHTWLISTNARNYFMEKATGTQGTMPKINQGAVSNTPIPIPPLAEQHRIMDKVDELMALYDRLKTDLAESRSRQARLATTLIESALESA